ncbi:GNAT family N-acetyltransferase [Piscirickettsia salmonis]|uniref:GNAT family N-acetyltransferase n=1 Tax=Piscirickettsia salmonis TaxID=1238 RepID=UPI003753AEDE
MKKQLMINNKIQLTLPTINHAIELFSLIDQYRSELREFLPWVDQTLDINNTRDYIKHCLSQYNNRSALIYLLYYQNNIAGTLSFNHFDKTNHNAKIGYWLAPCYQGQGLITIACQKFIEYGFNALNLKCVEIHCAINNIKSQNIPIRLGFTKTDDRQQEIKLAGNQYADAVIYSLVRY